jgi:hypothetical protein
MLSKKQNDLADHHIQKIQSLENRISQLESNNFTLEYVQKVGTAYAQFIIDEMENWPNVLTCEEFMNTTKLKDYLNE